MKRPMHSTNKQFKDNKPKPGNKPVQRKEGVKRSMREMDQHDRARKHEGSKGYKGRAKRLEGKTL